MQKIQMVDLKSQYNKIKPEIDNAIAEVIESSQFIKGPKVEEFEKNLANYLDVRHVITCANGTDALQIALMALNLKPGDEIITTGFTFIATVEVIELLKLKPVFADVNPDTFNICPKSIRKVITPKTRAIVPVHLFGQVADMHEIIEIAKQNNLLIIEDTAQATGSKFHFSDSDKKFAGTIGDVGTTSFFPSKNLGCFGDGGALFTNNDELAKQLRCITNHGSRVKYHHDFVGVNSRLDTLQTAILSVKLKYLDQYNKARQQAAEYYNNAFKNINEVSTPVVEKKSEHIYHQYTIKVSENKRDELKNYLQEHNIPSMIYYPVPMYKQKAFSHHKHKADDTPISTQLCKEVLSLPMHTELDTEQLEYITNTVIDFFKL